MTARRATVAGAEDQVSVVISALRRALYAALYPRANGSRHDRNCRNRHVNASWWGCSDACLFAAGALLLGEDWEDGVGLPEVSTQANLFDSLEASA